MEEVVFFATPDDFRRWLAENHLVKTELWVGYYKVGTGIPSITWPESVDEALCFGWIDGIRYRIDDQRYKIRFTPRRADSVWSAVNIGRVQAMIEAGKMTPAGLKAYEARTENKSGIYTYEQRSVELPEPYMSMLEENEPAWEFYQRQTESYRKSAFWWVVSAKREETRLKRVEEIISHCAQGKLVPAISRPDARPR